MTTKTDKEKATACQKTPKHNWHLDANGVEVAKGQGEGVSESETPEREPSASREDLISHIDFLTRKRAQESQRYAKLWEERHDYKAHADKLAAALREADRRADDLRKQLVKESRFVSADLATQIRINVKQALAAYESEVQQ